MRDKLKFTILGLGLLAVILGLNGFTGNFTFGKSEALIDGKVVNEGEKHELVINFQVIDEHTIRKSYFINSFNVEVNLELLHC